MALFIVLLYRSKDSRGNCCEYVTLLLRSTINNVSWPSQRDLNAKENAAHMDGLKSWSKVQFFADGSPEPSRQDKSGQGKQHAAYHGNQHGLAQDDSLLPGDARR